MIARRLIVSLVLLALVSNLTVFAISSSSNTPNREGQAFTLVSLKAETAGAQTRILIESTAPPLYTVFRPSDRLIVIDLPGGDSTGLGSAYPVKNALVDSINVRQTRAGTSSTRVVTRVEVALRSEVRDRSSLNGNTLVIELSPAQASSARSKTEPASDRPLSVPASNKKTADANSSAPGVETFPAPTVTGTATGRANTQPVADRALAGSKSSAPSTSSALKPATIVRAVRSEAVEGGARIWVHTDGLAQFKDFVLPDPWRVVVDITGVRSEFGNKTAAVSSAAVDRVRVGQPSDRVVRVVLDLKSKATYTVEREGDALVITVGNLAAPRSEGPKTVAELRAQNNSNAPAREVKVASERVEKDIKNAATNTSAQAGKQQAGAPPSDILAQNRTSSGQSTPRVSSQPNRSLLLPSQPSTSSSGSVKETVTQTVQPTYNRSVMDVQPNTQPAGGYNTAPPSSSSGAKQSVEMAFCQPGFVGGLISFDLRAGVDIRDMLRFVSQQYGVNFIVDKSVGATPVDLTVNDVPWNQAIEEVLRAHRLGAVCANNGRMIRIATLGAIKEEQDQMLALAEAKAKQVPLVTKIIHLKYARAAGSLGDGGAGQSGRGGGGGTGAQAQGSLLGIINSRKSERGRIEMEMRTNSLIITDLPEYVAAMEDLIAKLDKPQPQVEIEARIVIASRNFLRDLGVELGAAAVNTSQGATGFLQTTPLQLQGTKIAPGGQNSGSGSGGSGSGGDSGSGSGGSSSNKGLGANLVGPFADTALRAGVANTVLSLTTGLIGTSIISSALSASETKGQIRTIASPRVTAMDNQQAEIVNGVQIPVQTVSNNTITTTFVTAALRLEITPQIIEDTGEVLMHVVAENNTVNFALANQFNNGTPGIDTQSAESTVRIADGGTTVMGGINVDTEGNTVNRTPGVSRLPVVGNLFKRKTTRRESSEILFFITPRIVHGDGMVSPRNQRSSVEGKPNPDGPQRAGTQSNKPMKQQTTAAANGKGGQ